MTGKIPTVVIKKFEPGDEGTNENGKAIKICDCGGTMLMKGT